MTEIIRNRIIRPSTRLEKSKSYKIDTSTISEKDLLVVNIYHESEQFQKTYKFNGSSVAYKGSISFRVNDFGDIIWSGATPIKTKISNSKTTVPKSINLKDRTIKSTPKVSLINSPKAFAPISNNDTTILILGTMPGNKSLEIGEYYAHTRNMFWKVISAITKNDFPLSYSEKKELLLKSQIGVWDIVHTANRIGSLDNTINDEKPNDLDSFIAEHQLLKVIGFNGKKAEDLFNKYFIQRTDIKYISLPSTSPAKKRIDFENLCKAWQQIIMNS